MKLIILSEDPEIEFVFGWPTHQITESPTSSKSYLRVRGRPDDGQVKVKNSKELDIDGLKTCFSLISQSFSSQIIYSSYSQWSLSNVNCYGH